MELRTAIRREIGWLKIVSFRGSSAGIIGGFLGLASLFLVWYTEPGWWYHNYCVTGVAVILQGRGGLGDGIILFAAGSMIAVVWRFGFVAQAAGLLMFLLDFRSLQLSTLGTIEHWWAPQLFVGFTSGYMVALAAFLIVAFGGFVPIWRRAMPTTVPAISRIATHSPNAIRIRR